MENETSCKEQLRLLRTPFGLEQRAAYVHLDRIHEELDESPLLPSAFAPVLVTAGGRSSRRLAAGTAAAGEAATSEAAVEAEAETGTETAVSTVLIVGDQNAGKTSFLFCFSRNLFLQQLQLSSFLPLLRASFVNARLMFLSKHQLLRMQRAAAQQTATVENPAAATGCTATTATSSTGAGGAGAAAADERAAEEIAAGRPPAFNTPTGTGHSGDRKAEGRVGGEAAAEGYGSSRKQEAVKSSRRRSEDSRRQGAVRWTSTVEEEDLLYIARDELPFLDSDVARALVLFTLEDFLFFCDEFGVPACSCGRAALGSSNVDSNNSSRWSGEESAAAFSSDLQAAGVRYVAVHLLEFGGDHLDRLLRFFQLTSRGELDSCYKDRGYSSTASSPTHIQDSSSGNRERSTPCHSGTRRVYAGRSRTGAGASKLRVTNRESAETLESCPGGTGSDDGREFTCCANGVSHWRAAIGRGSAAERAVAVKAAKQILQEEQQRFQQALLAKAVQEQLAFATAAEDPGAPRPSAGAGAAPLTPAHLHSAMLCVHAVSDASAAGLSSVFPADRAAAPAADTTPAVSCGGEAGGDTGSGERPSPAAGDTGAAAAGNHDEAEGRRAVRPAAATPAAIDRRGSQTQSTEVQAAAAREEEKAAGGDGDTPHSAAAGPVHKLSFKGTSARAAKPAKPNAVADAAEDSCIQSLQLLQVLQRSAQLLSEASHTLYFINCSSLMPSLHPCTRRCCSVSGVCMKECFALDPAAFAGFVGRLWTLAVVQQCGGSSRSSESRNSWQHRCNCNLTNSSGEHCPTCVFGTTNCSRSKNYSGSNQYHSCDKTHEPLLAERHRISFICCRLLEWRANISAASELHSDGPGPAAPSISGAGAATAAGGGGLSEKQLLERCCSYCMRENFNTAMQLLRSPYAKQQQRQQRRISPKCPGSENTRPEKHQRWFSSSNVRAAEGRPATAAADVGAAVAAAADAAVPCAPDAGTKGATRVSTKSEVPDFPHVPHVVETKSESTAARTYVPGGRRVHAAVAGGGSRLSSAQVGQAACHAVAAAAVDQEDKASGFRLFLHLLHEAAAAAGTAATGAGAREIEEEEEEEERAAAAAEEKALRGSPRFLFVHALLHFMWAWQAAGHRDAGAVSMTSSARGAAADGRPTAGPLGAGVEEAALLEEPDVFLANDDGRIAKKTDTEPPAQLTPERTAPVGGSFGRSEPAGRRDTTGDTAGDVRADEDEFSLRDTSAAAEKQGAVGGEADCIRYMEGRRRGVVKGCCAFTSANAELQRCDHKREKESGKGPPLSRMQQLLAHSPSQVQVVRSTLQLQAVQPVQLFHVENQRQPQQHGMEAPMQGVREQEQHVEAAEEGQMQERQQQEQKGPDTLRLRQPDQHTPTQENEQHETPLLKVTWQQQREKEHTDEVGELQEELSLLQSPFRVGAVVNLFATLLRLGCMPRQKKPVSSQRLPAEAYTKEEATATVLTRVPAAPPAARQRDKGSDTVSVLIDEQPKTRADAGSPSQLAATVTAAAPAPPQNADTEGKMAVLKCTAADAAAGGKAVVAPTGELGRQLLLSFLRLAKEHRQFVPLRTGSAHHAGEAEAVDAPVGTAVSIQAAGVPPVPETALVNIWFSSVDATLLLNDDEEASCCSCDIPAVEERLLRQSRRRSCAFDGGAAAPTPFATSLSQAVPCTAAPFPTAATGYVPAPDAPAAGAEATFSGAGVVSRAAADAQEACAAFERLHEQMGRTDVVEEASILPASTVLQLLPTLLAGLVKVSAASPYDASAAPFPPVLLELRWVQECPLPSAAALTPRTAAASPGPCRASSFSASAPLKAAKKLPTPAHCPMSPFKVEVGEMPERRCSPSGTLTAPAPAVAAAGGQGKRADTARAAAAAAPADAKGEPRAPDTVAFNVMESVSYAQPSTSASTGSTAALEGEPLDGSTGSRLCVAAHRIAAREAELPQRSTATAAESSATVCTAVAPAAAVTSPPPQSPTVSCCHAPPVASRQCVKLLLAPADLLRQLQSIDHRKNAAGRTSTSEQRSSTEAAAAQREKRASAAKWGSTLSAGTHSCGSTSLCVTYLHNGAEAAKERTAKEGPAVRMALQDQLFNFVYYSLQEAVRAGPLPAGFWRRENCVLWEGCSSASDAASVCCGRNNDSRRTGSSTTGGLRSRTSLLSSPSLESRKISDSCSSSSCHSTVVGQSSGCGDVSVDVAMKAHWLDCVEHCVLGALYTQVERLCASLHRYANCVAETTCSCSLAAAGPSAIAGGLGELSEKRPVNVDLLRRPHIQQGDLQVEQHGEKKANERRQRQWGQLRTVDQGVRRSRAGTPPRKNLSIDLVARDCATRSASAAAEVAAAAHLLIQLAGDMVLLAGIKNCGPHGDASSTRPTWCSDGTTKVPNGRATSREELPSGSPHLGIAAETRAGQAASSTTTAVAAATEEAPANVKSPASEFRWEQAATTLRAGAAEAHRAVAGIAGCESVTGDAPLVTPGDTSHRSKLGSYWRSLGSSPSTREKTGTRSDSAGACVRWWVEDKSGCPGNALRRKVVLEVLVDSCSSVCGDWSFPSSAAAANRRPMCDLPASIDVATTQKQLEVIAALANVLQCSRNLHQQQEQEVQQHSQQERRQQHISYVPDSRTALVRGHRTCREEEGNAAANETQDPSERFYLRGDSVGAGSASVTAADCTDAAACWLKLLCQLQDENVNMSFV